MVLVHYFSACCLHFVLWIDFRKEVVAMFLPAWFLKASFDAWGLQFNCTISMPMWEFLLSPLLTPSEQWAVARHPIHQLISILKVIRELLCSLRESFISCCYSQTEQFIAAIGFLSTRAPLVIHSLLWSMKCSWVSSSCSLGIDFHMFSQELLQECKRQRLSE